MEASLQHTKQKKQNDVLKLQLEKFGVEILDEQSRQFLERPKWNHSDEIPNLVATWNICTKGHELPKQLDFIAQWDWKKNETLTTDCSHCELRNGEIKLNFFKDTQLRIVTNQLTWEKDVAQFCVSLLEKMKQDGK
jgi:hypothetical protein